MRWPLLRPDCLLPAEVPSVEDVLAGPRDLRMSLGPQVAANPGEPSEPRSWRLKIGQVVRGDGEGRSGVDSEQPGGDLMRLFLLPSRFQRPVVAPPGANLSAG